MIFKVNFFHLSGVFISFVTLRVVFYSRYRQLIKTIPKGAIMITEQQTESTFSDSYPMSAGLQLAYAKKRKQQSDDMIVTSKEVAQMAGVSVATVSRVVNKARNVREATRDKVQRAIQTLNYVPNEFAQQMARQRFAAISH